MTFKDDVYAVCKTVASELDGWSFASGAFKNRSLKYLDMVIRPGLAFSYGSTVIEPSVWMIHKKAEKLFKSILGYDHSASLISFNEMSTLTHMPAPLRVSARIFEDKPTYLSVVRMPGKDKAMAKLLEEEALNLSESYPVLQAMMQDGMDFIAKNYDLSSEENFLKALPVKHTTRNNIPYREFEMHKGVMLCLVHMLYGDFVFFEHYRSDDFKTAFPKNATDLDKIAASLPELKRRYAETGSVI